MPRVQLLFRCIGQAVCANGMKALAGLVPLGGVVYEIAEDACRRLHEEHQDDQLRDPVEAAAQATGADLLRHRASLFLVILAY